jgi:hypothetical protein
MSWMRVKSGTASNLNSSFELLMPCFSFTPSVLCASAFCGGREFSGWINACLSLHHWIGVAYRFFSAGSQPRLLLVFCALQGKRILCRAKCRCDLLYFCAANGEWSGFRSRSVHGCASHTTVRVECSSYQPRERKIRDCRDQRPWAFHPRGYS